MHVISHRLESLDSKIRVYHSRRDAISHSRSSDRDSPFTPMAIEIPTTSRTNTSTSLLPAPQQDENFLYNTPLSTPPDSSVDENKVPGTCLNTGTITVAFYCIIQPLPTELH